ncbi:MAG: hypothetical protein J6D30_00295 [Clostridia bacterium]|nr:hypothetical protein [Clostridia bacterium]
MAQQKKSLVARLLEGKERSEEYARSTLPTNRWQLFWDIFKGSFGKLVKVNLLVLLFCIPSIVVIIFNQLLVQYNSIIYPFGANLGVGYPADPVQPGLAEMLVLNGNLTLYIGLTLSMFIASVGFAGGMYVIRNMVWSEGIFVAHDFWKGVKLNYKNALQTSLFFCLVLTVCGSLIHFTDLMLAMGGMEKVGVILLWISKIASYTFIFMAAIMTLWMLAQGVNYELRFLTMLRNSLLVGVATIPQTLFFGGIAILPFALFFLEGTFFTMLAVMGLIFISFSFALLVWLNFAQWVFDRYINPKIKGAKVSRGLYSKESGESLTEGELTEEELQYRKELVAAGRSKLIAHPIKPIDDGLEVYELPQSFTREDLKRLRESKDVIAEDTKAYAEEHKNDERYVKYNEEFDAMEKALQEPSEDEKKKKQLRILRK